MLSIDPLAFISENTSDSYVIKRKLNPNGVGFLHNSIVVKRTSCKQLNPYCNKQNSTYFEIPNNNSQFCNMIDESILHYAEAHSTPDQLILQELQRETFLKVLLPAMISSPLQGALLRIISEMLKPQQVLEIGTFTGYSALCLASGIPNNGRLDTIDCNEELSTFHEKYFPLLPQGVKIKAHYGNALTIIPTLSTTYDLVFIDADKQNYKAYYELALQYAKTGAWIIIDNVLWKGKVLNPANDKDAVYLDSFNKQVNNDGRVDNVLLPIRDGLLVIKKL